jgi:AsmA protein
MAVIPEEITTPKPTPSHLLLRVSLLSLVAFLALSVVAPFVNAAHFSESIQRALEASLGRHVSFDKVYYRLLPVPGFSLENVTIGEDPRYGLEPFSYMDGLEARLRIDKLLLGQIRFASLRLIDPTLNMVKRDDGAWNVVEFVERMTAPRAMPLNLIPAIQVSGARLDFKLGIRKTTFYLTAADISIYPERSGRVILNFSGSPARTDRAGNGFGSLRGTLNWLVAAPSTHADQVEADVTLEPSNFSELATLIQGQDIGVHGTISSEAHIAGPLAALKVTGALRLRDVHRWDLLPSSGDDWRVPYSGVIDMLAHSLDLRTLPPRPGEAVPAALQVKVNDFMTKPAWTLMTSLHNAPVESLLPLFRRMGFGVPNDVALSGAVNGVVGYSNASGLSGEVSIRDAVATLPNIPPISAAGADLKILSDALHLEPATLETTGGGAMRVGGDYNWNNQRLAAAISVNHVSVQTLKNTAKAWFGSPPALAAFGEGGEGVVTGELQYDNSAGTAGGWSGDFEFSNATLSAVGVAVPLEQAQGKLLFTPDTLDVPHFSGAWAHRTVSGNYHYNQKSKPIERLHLELEAATFEQMTTALEPAWREPGLLARLPFTTRSIPSWLAARNLEGDLAIAHFLVAENDLGPLNTRFVWQGVDLHLSALQILSPDVSLRASGTVNLAARAPSARFKAALNGYRWGGGLVDAQGLVESSGVGIDALRSLHAAGSFSASAVSLSLNQDFDKVSGAFDLSFTPGWPKLHLSKVQAVQPNDDWSGEALSNSDGQLTFDLSNGDRQLHIVSLLAPSPPALTPAAVAGR